MTDIVSPLLQWLYAHPELAGLVTFIISAGESVAVIGTIVPGSIMMTALGTLAGAGVIPLWGTIFWAILGAIAGDGISYWIGHYFKDGLNRIWPFRKYPALLKTGEAFVSKYGVMSVFIGRFVGPVRALVPVTAGMLGMKPLPFTIANVTSAIGWAPAYMLPGILLGAASLELPPDIAIHVILVLLLIALFIILCLWMLYKLLRLYHAQTDQLQTHFWEYCQRSRTLRPLTVLLQHHDPTEPHGQLSTAIYFLITTLLFAALILLVKEAGAAHLMVNDAIFHLFRGIRTNIAEAVMIDITLLGQKQVILPVVMIIFAWLVYWRRWRTACHGLALAILAAGSVYVIKNLVKSPRPWGIFASPETYSMPSGHTTIATTVFMGLAFLIATSIDKRHRPPIYAIGLLIPFLVGISRLYLGAHWFTDVLSAWLLGAAVLMVIILSYERKNEKRVNPIGITFITVLAFFLVLGIYHHRHFNELKLAYSLVDWPSSELSGQTFWETNGGLPAYNVSLFGFPSQAINIEWVGDIHLIQETLEKEGWQTPPARDLVSTLHRMADVKSTQYLPMISPQYLDKTPELIFARRDTTVKGLLVLRLWNSNRTLKETGETIWVGTLSEITRSYSWLYKSHPHGLAISPDYLFPNKKMIHPWEWKLLPKKQPVLLIRNK